MDEWAGNYTNGDHSKLFIGGIGTGAAIALAAAISVEDPSKLYGGCTVANGFMYPDLETLFKIYFIFNTTSLNV